MNNRTFYNEVLTDHNRYPGHKEKLADANLVLEGVNPSCGDDIVLQLRVEDGRIAEGTFTGDGCAISQASVDIMLDLVIGKSFWLTVKKFLKVEDSCCLANFFVDFVFWYFTKFQSECHVVIYCHMWIKSIVLEYHCDISVFWLYIIHYFSVNLQCTAGNILKTCDHTKCC